MIKKMLSISWAYWALQKWGGGENARKKYVLDYIQPKPNMKILDIGCGPGNMAPLFKDCEYFGIDPSETYIKSAKENFGQLGDFYCGNILEKNIFEGQSFDIIHMTGVLHHVDDPTGKQLISYCKSMLNSKGCLWTLDGCITEHQSILKRTLLNLDRGKFVRNLEGYLALSPSTENIDFWILEDLFWPLPYTAIITKYLKP